MTKTPSRRDALVLTGALTGGLVATAANAATTSRKKKALPPPARTVLITGANRGIGLGYVRQYQTRTYRIIATARRPDEAAELQALAKADRNILVEALDVTDLGSVDALAAKYKGMPIDILINNAGVIGEPEKEIFGSMPYGYFDAVMNTNVRGPLKVSEAFIDNIAASTEKKLVVMTSSGGSVASVKRWGQPIYRASKAALNMVMRNVALAVKDRGVLVGLICPGGVDTDMNAAFRGKVKFRPVDEAVHDLIALIDALNAERSGVSYNYDGNIMPW